MHDRGDDTRSRLLQATVDTLLARGWGGVTTRVVAERAGVRPGLVHYHFGSIDDLRREAVVATLHSHFDPFIEMAAVLAPLDLVDVAVDAFASEFAPGTGLSNLLYEVMPAASRDDRLRDAIGAILERFRATLADTIRRYHPTPLVPADVLAEVVSAAIDGLQLHLVALPGLDLSAHVRALLPLFGPPVTDTGTPDGTDTDQESSP